MRRTQWSAALLAGLLFSVGVVAGALGHRYYTTSVAVPNQPLDTFREHYVSDMKSRLKLTSKQVDQLEIILDDTKSKFRAAHESCRPAISEVKQQQISNIKAILTAPQLPVYERLVAERESRGKEQEAKDREADARAAATRRSHLR